MDIINTGIGKTEEEKAKLREKEIKRLREDKQRLAQELT